MYVLANTIGIFAIVIWVISIQNIDKKGILIYQIIANILYGLQYFLLGAYSASTMDFISGFRCLFFYLEEEKSNKISNYSIIFFTILIIILGIFTYNGIISILPILTSLIYMYSLWQNNLNVTRYLFVIAAFVWLCYNINVGTHINIIGNSFEIISGIVSIIRFKGGSK